MEINKLKFRGTHQDINARVELLLKLMTQDGRFSEYSESIKEQISELLELRKNKPYEGRVVVTSVDINTKQLREEIENK